jgi:eukaryotic-like serine/threonine-protein kinase
VSAKDGRVLLTRDDLRAGIIGLAPGETKERDLSWHDWTVSRDISDDGRLVSFDETGDAGGDTGGLYVRRTDGSPAVRLGDGLFPVLSPEGGRVLAISFATPGVVLDLPTGAGEPRTISTGGVRVQRAFFFPDAKHILELGSATGSHAPRLWVQNSDGGAPVPISPEGVTTGYRSCISPDGKRVAAQDPQGGLRLIL